MDYSQASMRDDRQQLEQQIATLKRTLASQRRLLIDIACRVTEQISYLPRNRDTDRLCEIIVSIMNGEHSALGGSA